MEQRTKEDVDRYLDVAKGYVLRSALDFKNAIKRAPEHEELSYLTKKLSEEVGEVAEALIERDYEQAIAEIGDVLWTAIMLAVRIAKEHEEDKKRFPSTW